MLATCPEAGHRDGSRAIEDATRACELTEWEDGHALTALAAAHAEAGDLKKAVATQKRALADEGFRSKKDRARARKFLDSFESNKPLRGPDTIGLFHTLGGMRCD